MILPDTNVISECMRANGEPHVQAWMDQQPPGELQLTAPVFSELLLGVALLPDGARKLRLASAIDVVVRRYFSNTVLPFDAHAARAYAGLIAEARKAGRAIAIIDGQIAAIARTMDATVATRDISPFEAAGVRTINPWHRA